jgi:hypothetical protein
MHFAELRAGLACKKDLIRKAPDRRASNKQKEMPFSKGKKGAVYG